MQRFFERILSDDLMPHGMCFLWKPELLWLHAVSDSLIALAYYSIPFALGYFVWKRRDIAFRKIFVLFGVFILACGTTHIMGVWTLWNPDYAFDGAVKVVTAVSSVGTGILLWQTMPQAIALPSPSQWEAANRSLAMEIGERRDAEDRVRRLNAELEDRVRDRTAELERANEQLASSVADKEILLQEIHHRVKNNLQVISGLLTLQARSAGPELDVHFQETQQRIRTMSRVHEQLHLRSNVATFDMRLYLSDLCRDLSELYGAAATRVSCRVDAAPFAVDFNSATPLVLIVNEVLSNAFKHAFRGRASGSIVIAAAEEDGAVALSIRDDGVGLPSDHVRRSETSTGLRLIQNLARQIGASASFSAGEGTTFTLRLPRVVAAEGAVA